MSLQFIWRRDTSLPCPLYHFGVAGIHINHGSDNSLLDFKVLDAHTAKKSRYAALFAL
jgi:hypothetical protein